MKNQDGFSLIEALVALAVLAIATVGLVRAVESHVDSTRGLERSTVALGVARLREGADRYDADYCIAPLADLDPADPPPFERVHANGTYGVYRLMNR